MACSIATKPSSTLSIPCSTSMRNGLKCHAASPGAGRLHPSTICSAPTSGGRTTTDSRIRTPASSIVANKDADIVRIYFPPDANTLLCVTDHCLRTYDRINVIVAGKQPALQWLSMEEADAHCTDGNGIWHWAGTEGTDEPDLVMACAGDVPTLETLAAVSLLREAFPDLKIRVVNVVDLMALQPREQHPHGLSDKSFDRLFTRERPVIFAYHGYPYMIHRLAYNRSNHNNMHVRGYREKGTTTTPFDMVVLNELDRYHLAIEAIERIPGLQTKGAAAKQAYQAKLTEHHRYVREHGEDMPDVKNWRWPHTLGSN